MTAITACVVACCIPAGPLNWQLIQIGAVTGINIFYDFDDIRGEGLLICGHTVNDLLNKALAASEGYWQWVDEQTVDVRPGIPWCAPERGHDAPSPPCRKRISI